MAILTPKAQMLLDALNESLEDLVTECWTKESKERHEKVKNELTTLTALLTKENK